MKLINSVSIHQPHFLPWPPYFFRIACSEIFVILDNVNYRRHYFQDRTLLINKNGKPFWASIPTTSSINKHINQTSVDRTIINRVIRKLVKRVHLEYKGYPYYNDFCDALFDFLKKEIPSETNSSIVDINIKSILLLFEMLDIVPPKIYLSSTYSVNTYDRTDYVVKLIKETGATSFLTGWGGSVNPLLFDHGDFLSERINTFSLDRNRLSSFRPEYIDFKGVSLLHWLFLYGKDKIRDDLESIGKFFIKIENLLQK